MMHHTREAARRHFTLQTLLIWVLLIMAAVAADHIYSAAEQGVIQEGPQ